MYRIFFLLFAALSIMSGTIDKGKEFSIRFVPPKDIKVSKFYLDRVMNDKLVRDSVELVNGAVQFKGTVETPMKARLVLITPEKEVHFVDVILEPAAISIEASKGLQEIVYSGSKTQTEFYQWKAGEGPIIKQLNERWSAVSKASREGNKEAERKAREEIQVLADALRQVKEQFLLNNTKSLVSALMLKDYVTPVWENLETAEKVYRQLPAEIKSLPDLQKFGKELAIASSISKGKFFPDITLPDSTGKLLSSAAYKGKYVLVDFWASWCGPCRGESPALREAYSKYKDKGFDILSISFDKDTKAWLQAVAKDGYTWGNVVDTTGMGQKGKISAQYNIMAIPRNFLLDKEGKIIATNLRGEGLEKKLKEVFGS